MRKNQELPAGKAALLHPSASRGADGAVGTVWSGVVRLERPELVPPGRSLTLLAGTRVVVSASIREPALTVLGELRAEGSAERGGRIVFFPEGALPATVRLGGAGRATLACVEFLQGETGLLCEDDALASVRDCVFWELAAMGAQATGRARVSFEGSTFARCATGAAALDEASLTLERCRLHGSPECGVNGFARTSVSVRGCAFEANHTALSVSGEARADARENDFHANLVGAHAKGRARLNLWRNRFHGRPALDVDVVEDAAISALREPAWEGAR